MCLSVCLSFPAEKQVPRAENWQTDGANRFKRKSIDQLIQEREMCVQEKICKISCFVILGVIAGRSFGRCSGHSLAETATIDSSFLRLSDCIKSIDQSIENQ